MIVGIDDDAPYNPLDKRHLGLSVAQALLQRPVYALTALRPFDGAGIYAIYYTGAFPTYQLVAALNQESQFKLPIYVGKAIAKGGRKGFDLTASVGRDLYKRLQEHLRSIQEAINLDQGDFYCRYLVVDDIWIPLAESLLIAQLNPLWNQQLDGFGNHDPGKGRHQGLRPRWDVVHPGRPWAARCKPRPESAAQIEQALLEHLQRYALISQDPQP